jgi:hypothetical protein
MEASSFVQLAVDPSLQVGSLNTTQRKTNRERMIRQYSSESRNNALRFSAKPRQI